MLAANAQPIHELIELPVAAERQITLEDQAVHTTQSCYNGFGELRHKLLSVLHGVLLPEGL